MHNHWTTNQFKYRSPYFTEQLISQNELCTTTKHGHLKDKAFMIKIASKRHQVADWIPPPQAGKQLIEAPYPFAETIQQHTISFSFASITTEQANQRPGASHPSIPHDTNTCGWRTTPGACGRRWSQHHTILNAFWTYKALKKNQLDASAAQAKIK